MQKSNRIKTVISSLIVLAPVLFGLLMWDRLPENIITHWGADGSADGVSAKALAVFGLPVILLIMHWVCLFFTARDNRKNGQSPKVMNLVFLIVPAISVYSNGMVYSVALGRNFDVTMAVLLPLGVLLLFIGNYLPKTRRNNTFGIKIYWTLASEQNWNLTHRLAGRVWVICGFVMLVCAFLPGKIVLILTALTVACAVVIPTVYSYCLYRKDKRRGVEYAPLNASKPQKLAVIVSIVVIVAVLAAVAVLMCTGEIEAECSDRTLKITASYWPDAQIAYSDIDCLEYLESFDKGTRTNGFGSPRLSMGAFQNDTLGNYTLYAYTTAQQYIVLRVDGEALAVGLKDTTQTKALYDELLGKIGE